VVLPQRRYQAPPGITAGSEMTCCPGQRPRGGRSSCRLRRASVARAGYLSSHMGLRRQPRTTRRPSCCSSNWAPVHNHLKGTRPRQAPSQGKRGRYLPRSGRPELNKLYRPSTGGLATEFPCFAGATAVLLTSPNRHSWQNDYQDVDFRGSAITWRHDISVPMRNGSASLGDSPGHCPSWRCQ
jgi:hypothetical protein